MITRLTLLIGLCILVVMPVSAQSASGQILARINELRTSLGLSGYTTNSSLTAAAQNHASWMTTTGKVNHTQDDGSGPRTRAQNAGYSSNWVSENIYLGSDGGIGTAWNFWVNSPIHYAGMTSPNYNNIGIGSVNGTNGHALVLVFGNSVGSLPQSVSTGADAGGGSAGAPALPSFVVGVDAIGNIMHEVQPGNTVGDIALIYGYKWEDVPYMLDINGMTEDDVPFLEIGSVFLVPPQDGTYTPTFAPPTQTPTMTATATVPPQTATENAFVSQMVAPATFVLPSETPSPAIRVRAMPTQTPTPLSDDTPLSPPRQDNGLQIMLVLAVILQVGIIGFATGEFLRRSR